MKQYESYKDSGIKWLGKIPSQWRLVSFKRLFSFGRGLSITKADLVEEGIPVISYGQIHSKQNTGTKVEQHLLRYVPKSYIEGNNSSKVNKGDFIFADTSEDLEGCGNCVYIDNNYLIYAGYHSIIARSIQSNDNKYLSYLFKTDCWRSQIRSSVYGVKVFSVTQSTLSDSMVILPPIEEQTTIVSYLDYKVGQIDATIAEKEQILEDLKAYRSAIISEAVTKGLDKDVEMKDSGIEWLGMIPAKWDCSSLKRFLSQPLQYGANESAESTNPDWPRYIRITDIDEYGNLRDETFKSLDPEKANDYLLEKGDVLFARSGATVGKTYIFNENHAACFAGYLIKAKCGEKLLPEFLYLYTNSIQYDNWKNSVFIQATIQNIGADKYSLLPIVVPSIDEQQRILDYVNAKLCKLSSVITDVQSQIDDLKKYKSSIITEAVTGKVDLRDWKPYKK